jgi:hypothetical protein
MIGPSSVTYCFGWRSDLILVTGTSGRLDQLGFMAGFEFGEGGTSGVILPLQETYASDVQPKVRCSNRLRSNARGTLTIAE